MPEIARTMARIQAAIASAQSGGSDDLLRVPVSRTAKLYDELVSEVRNRYLAD